MYRKAASTLANFDYLYNTAGMITQKVAKIGSSITTNRYSYDDLDRLVSENITGAVTSTATFAYDLVGNRTNMVLNAVTNKYTFSNGCDRLVSWGTNNESTASYSPAGCATGLFYSATNKLYLTWNSEYQLTSVATGTTSAVLERNAYDALGRRAWSWGWDGNTTNYFLYDGVNLAAEVDSTGGMRRAYAYGPGIDNILSMTVYTGTTVKTYFYLKDSLGTVHAVTDSTGTNIVERYVYDAWGKLLDVRNGSGTKLTTTAIGNRWLWQGREYSWRTGLHFFRARWYDPITGRWLSNDPIGISGGLNQYEAFACNGVNFVDPLGLVIRVKPANRKLVLDTLSKFVRGKLSFNAQGNLQREKSADDCKIEGDVDKLMASELVYEIIPDPTKGGGHFDPWAKVYGDPTWQYSTGQGGQIFFNPKPDPSDPYDLYYTSWNKRAVHTAATILAHELLGRALADLLQEKPGLMGDPDRDKANNRAMRRANRAFDRMAVPLRTSYQ